MNKNTPGPARWFANFLARIAILVQVAILILAISMIFYGVFFSHRKFSEARSQAEASYWRLRWRGFVIGAYAVVIYIWAVIDANSSQQSPGLIDYWPALCMLWTDNSWFGAAGHASAVGYESILMGLVASVLAASARWFGSYDSDLDQFTPAR